MRKRQLVIVEWIDASTHNAWRDEKDTDTVKEYKCITVGWKQKSRRGYLGLASTRNHIGDCSDLTIIPRSCVRSIRGLE